MTYYVMFDEQSVGEVSTIEEGRKLAAEAAAKEPFSGSWAIHDADGNEVEYLGFGRGWFA